MVEIWLLMFLQPITCKKGKSKRKECVRKKQTFYCPGKQIGIDWKIDIRQVGSVSLPKM